MPSMLVKSQPHSKDDCATPTDALRETTNRRRSSDFGTDKPREWAPENGTGTPKGTLLTDFPQDGAPHQPVNSNDDKARKDGANNQTKVIVGKYRTRMCRNWVTSKSCPYGEHCMFAHGSEELQPEVKFQGLKKDLHDQVGRVITLPDGYRLGKEHAGKRVAGMAAIKKKREQYSSRDAPTANNAWWSAPNNNSTPPPQPPSPPLAPYDRAGAHGYYQEPQYPPTPAPYMYRHPEPNANGYQEYPAMSQAPYYSPPTPPQEMYDAQYNHQYAIPPHVAQGYPEAHQYYAEGHHNGYNDCGYYSPTVYPGYNSCEVPNHYHEMAQPYEAQPPYAKAG